MQPTRTEKQPAIRVLKITLLFLLVALICAGAFGASYLFGLDIASQLDPQQIYGADQSTLLYDTNDNVFANMHGLENRIWVSIDTVPQYVKDAFIATEDIRFYSHNGVDVKRIAGALIADIKAGALVEGASTITQQLIKNSFLTRKKTWSRKIEEALLALELERRYTKDEILEMYLNYNYFGAGAYGIEAAAQTYFSKSASQLTVWEGATLAGILKSPTRYAPHTNPDNAFERRNTVLSLMNRYGFLSDADLQTAKAQPLGLNLSEEKQTYGWYADAAMEQACEILGITDQELIAGGYRIYTAMDAELQALCEQAFADDSLFPENAADGTQPQAAIAIVSPKDGRVLAMVGGRSYTVQRGLNRATDIQRQPGSAIKPLMVYAPALSRKTYTAASMLEDAPKSFGEYTPSNFGNEYMGWVTLRTAVIHSLNIPAVEVLNATGIEASKDFAKAIGIPFEQTDNGLSLALGGFSTGVSPLQLAGGYAALASMGEYHTPTLIRSIENAQGEVLYQAKTQGTRVLSEQTAFILSDILAQAITEGTGKNLAIDHVPLCGKSGTNGYEDIGNRDSWFAAYNADLAAVAWMGYDVTDDAHVLPKSATGGAYTAKLLRAVLEPYYQDKVAPTYTAPNGIVKVKLQKTALMQNRLVLADETTPAEEIVEDYILSEQLPTPAQTFNCSVFDFAVGLSETGHPVLTFSASSDLAQYAIYRESAEGIGLLTALAYAPTLRYEDESAAYGTAYTYYVQPIASDGAPMGESSPKLVVVPQQPVLSP